MKNLKKMACYAVGAFGAIAILLSSVPSVQAQAIDGSLPDSVVTPAGENDEWKFTVGAGPAMVPDYEGSDDYDVVPAPVLRAGRGPIYAQLFGAKITSNFINHENWRLGPLVNFRRKRGDVENSRVQAMKTVDATVEAGVKGGYDFILPGGTLSLEVEFAHDIGNEHDGWTLAPQITFKRQWQERWSFAVQGAMDFASDDYMETYFGVGPGNTGTSGFSNYSPDAGGKDFRFAGALGYQFNRNWGITGVAQWKRLIGDADDSSPVVAVGSENQAILALFATYTFGS